MDSHRAIESILEDRRLRARLGQEARRKHAYAAIPGLEAVEYDISAAGVRHSKALLDNAKSLGEALEGIGGDALALNKKRAGLLAGGGLAADYLDIRHTCGICCDKGYIVSPGGYPERCSCYRQLLYDSLESASNIMAAGEAGFERFDIGLFSDKPDEAKYRNPESPRENINRVRESAMRYICGFKNGVYENLFFFGQPGTGKSFMAASIACELMKSGAAVLYLSAPALFNIMTERRMVSMHDDGYIDSSYKQVYDCKLLIIDDLGTESLTESRFSELVALLNARLAPGRFSTIIVSNMDLKNLKARYDERVFSRILGSFSIVRFYGDDIRQIRQGGRA